MSTPREEAIKMINKFKQHVKKPDDYNRYFEQQFDDDAKECAIITVEAIIEVMQKHPLFEFFMKEYKYWVDVLWEISEIE